MADHAPRNWLDPVPPGPLRPLTADRLRSYKPAVLFDVAKPFAPPAETARWLQNQAQTGWHDGVSGLDYHEGARLAVATNNKGSICMMDVNAGEAFQHSVDLKNKPDLVRFGAHPMSLFYSTREHNNYNLHRVNQYCVTTHKVVACFVAHPIRISSLVCDVRRDVFFTADEAGTVYTWDARLKTAVSRHTVNYSGLGHCETKLAMSHSGWGVAVASFEVYKNTPCVGVRIHDPRMFDKFVKHVAIPDPPRNRKSRIVALSYSADDSRLLLSTAREHVVLSMQEPWEGTPNAATLARLPSPELFDLHGTEIQPACFDGSGKYVAAVGWPGCKRVAFYEASASARRDEHGRVVALAESDSSHEYGTPIRNVMFCGTSEALITTGVSCIALWQPAATN